MNLKIIGSLLLFLSPLFCLSQEEDIMPDIIPEPNAMSMQKIVDFPANHNSGASQVNIPIYKTNSGSLEVPISLNYHASGIKVEQRASHVGLGWTLNAGGLITRTIRGNPDDGSSKGFIFAENENTVSYARTLDHYDLHSMWDGTQDYEPDEFTFNFQGLSGKFYYNQEEDRFVFKPLRKDINITPYYNTDKYIVGWKLVDKNGTQYFFGTNNVNDTISEIKIRQPFNLNAETKNLTGNNFIEPSKKAYTSWYLKNIISSDKKDTISFEYEEILVKTVNKIREVETVYYNVYYDSRESKTDERVLEFIKKIETQKLLRRINFNKGYIEFHNNKERNDIEGGKGISEIVINNKKNEYIKSYCFYTSYFKSPSLSLDLPLKDYNDSTRLKRLRLDSLREIGDNEVKGKKWTFNYYNKYPLPDLFSNSQDFLGYYNGINNESLLTRYQVSPEGFPIYLGNSQVNRSGSINFAKMWSLKEILYPTGGRKQIIYDQHKIANEPGSGAENINEFTYNEYVSLSKKDSFMAGVYRKEFTISGNEPVRVDWYASIVCEENTTPGDEMTLGCSHNIGVNGISEGTGGFAIPDGSGWTMLNPGNYALAAIENDNSGEFAVNLTITYDSTVVDTIDGLSDNNGNIVLGGCRIDSIITKNSSGIVEKSKSFQYVDQNGISSGRLLHPLEYLSIHVEDLYEISEETVDHSYRYDYSSSGIFSTKQSVPIHYSEIVEKNNDFKTYYQYNSPSVPLMQIKSTFPYIPVFTHDYHRKKIRKKIKYTYLNNKYKTIEKDIYQYKIFNGDHIQPLKIGKLNFINEISSPGSAEWVCDEMLFKCADYQILNVEKKLSSKKTTHFFYDDFGELKDSSNKSQTYKYNSETLNLKQTRTINEEDTLTDKYYYLSDFDENLNTNYIGNFDLLENKNLLYKPIKIENYYNSTLSDAKVIQYNEDCKKKAIYKLNKRTDNQDDYHSDFIIDNDFFEEQIGFDYYDNSKRLKQVNTKQNDIITYLWGYNWLYPVSRITGKSFDEVSSKLTNLGYSINSIQSFSDQELNNVMIQLREQIECGMVESFNYKILKGLIRSFDANGNEKTYHYDELGRLKRILDNNQKIIKEFDYNYNQIFFNIYLSSNSEGTVNPSGKKSFPYGSDVTYDFIPNTGYKIDSVLIDGKMRGTFSSYTFSDITENHSLEVIFNPKEYNINIYQNNGGTVDLLDPAPYHYNNQVQVNIVPEEGYYVDQILIDGESVTPQNTFSFTVTDNHDIEVSFSKIQYNISIDHSSGGSVNPSGNQIIYYGESITLEFNPEIDYLESYSEDGSITIPDDPSVIEMIYEVADVRIDGEWIGPVYSYTFNNIKEPHDVYVSFQKKTFTISETHNNGGTVNPSGTNTFNYGSTAIYNFSPNQDYSIGEVFVDGTSVGSVSSYQFSDIVSDHSIDVNFNLNEYEINVYALNTNLGNITYTVQPGENLTINIAPDYNYSITSVEVDGVDQGPITSYTFEEIHSSHTVTVYTIYTGGSGGFIHP